MIVVNTFFAETKETEKVLLNSILVDRWWHVKWQRGSIIEKIIKSENFLNDNKQFEETVI